MRMAVLYVLFASLETRTSVARRAWQAGGLPTAVWFAVQITGYHREDVN